MKTAEPGIERVLMTTDTIGGVWPFTLELAHGLASQGIEVMLAALGGNPSDAQRSEAAAIPNLCLLSGDYRLEWMEDPWEDVEQSGAWLLDVEREYRPDLVHLNSFGHGSLPWHAPTILTAHSCVMSWWEAVRRGDIPPLWDRYRATVEASLRCVDLVTAPSGTMSAALSRHYGFEASRTIANGRSSARFKPGQKRPIVFTAGRLWDEAKNVAAIARIAPEITWPVFVAGDPQGATFSGCNLLGRLSAIEIAAWYAGASIYALPARYEPFGLSILEAALSGCALVLGDIPSLREIWGDAALYASPEDKTALREAIDTLIRNPTLRQIMSKRAHMRALAFSAEHMTQRYLDAYRAAIATWSAPCVS